MTIVLDEYLVINSRAFATPNCKGIDVVPFIGWGARYAPRIMPGAAGARSTTPVRDVLVVNFDVLLRGDVDEDGAPIADARSGLRALISTLRTEVVGEQTAELHLVGATLEADVVVPRFDPVTTSHTTATLLLQVVVPSGEFT